VRLKKNEVVFRTDNATIVSRLLEGRFPPYKRILPADSQFKIPLPVGEFLSVVRQAAILTDADIKKIELRFTPGLLTIQSQGFNAGKSKVSMKIDGDFETSIKFDPNYVSSMLRVIDQSEIIHLHLNGPKLPGVFRVGDDFVYLVMPLE